jgi:hypothetical protein
VHPDREEEQDAIRHVRRVELLAVPLSDPKLTHDDRALRLASVSFGPPHDDAVHLRQGLGDELIEDTRLLVLGRPPHLEHGRNPFAAPAELRVHSLRPLRRRLGHHPFLDQTKQSAIDEAGP